MQISRKEVGSSQEDQVVSNRPKAVRYSPYIIDWRFLPEPILLMKDLVRPQLLNLNFSAARSRLVGPFWRSTIGRRTSHAIQSSGKLFIHIPKTGGTSISKNLYGRNLPHYTAAFYEDVFPGLLHSVTSFAVIRDPMERIMSSYRFILAGGTELMATNRYAKFLVEKAASFDGFIDALHRNPQRSHVFEAVEQQVNYVARDGVFLVDYLFTLNARRGFSSALSKVMDVSALPHLNGTGQVRTPISTETEAKVREMYNDDFCLFEALNRTLVEPSEELRSLKGWPVFPQIESS